MKILESVVIPPSTNLIDTLGFSGYSIQAAIADIVDNSIAANATKIELFFKFDYQNSTIKIVDNGYGMSKNELQKCLTIANKSIKDKRSEQDLGRFGLGLKSATSSNARILTITSKIEETDEINTIRMDIDKIVQTQNWEVDYVESFENIETSGTVVLWENLKLFSDVRKDQERDYFYVITERVEKHIGKVFFKYIDLGKIKFYINGNPIKGRDPFFTKHIKTRSLGTTIKEYKGHQIEIEPFILPVYEDLEPQDQIEVLGKGLEDEQGFYIYRNNRLIVDGGWLDIEGLKRDNKSNYARIRVSIPKELDEEFNINFAKNSATVPPILVETFRAIAKRARKESNDNFNYKINPYPKRKKKQEDLIKIWNLGKSQSGFYLEVNSEHPIIKELTLNINKKDRNKLFSLLSSTIPVDEIKYTGAYVTKELDKEEFEKTLIEEFHKLENIGMDRKHIYLQLGKEQPFSDNLSLVQEILVKRGLSPL